MEGRTQPRRATEGYGQDTLAQGQQQLRKSRTDDLFHGKKNLNSAGRPIPDTIRFSNGCKIETKCKMVGDTAVCPLFIMLQPPGLPNTTCATAVRVVKVIDRHAFLGTPPIVLTLEPLLLPLPRKVLHESRFECPARSHAPLSRQPITSTITTGPSHERMHRALPRSTQRRHKRTDEEDGRR